MARHSEPKPKYAPPRVVLHSRDEILRRAGPALGCARWGTDGVVAAAVRKLAEGETPKPKR